MQLCFACKKNQPVVLYKRKTVDGVRIEPYCLACNQKRFISENEAETVSVCPYCGWEAEQLRKTALVGCANCYRTLDGVIPAVIRMQQNGKDAHRGKVSENVRAKAKAERRYQELLALKEYYLEQGNAMLAARYEKNAKALESEIKRGNYDGV